MRDASRVEFFLEGLNCAACAAKIEEKAKRISHVNRASLNLATNVLAIDAANAKKHGQIMKDVSGMVKEIEPGVTVKILTGKGERTGPAAAMPDEEQRSFWQGASYLRRLFCSGCPII